MMPATILRRQVDLNFIVTGELRSGAAVVQSSINGSSEASCHADLFHPREQVRKSCHVNYFGPSDEDNPEWLTNITSPWQYLNHRVWDNPVHDESAVGLKILYPQIKHYELYDLIHERTSEGDFCVVHVIRNPIACLVSLKQARRSKIWSCPAEESPKKNIPVPVTLDPAELTAHVRDHFSIRAKIARSCPDALEVPYSSLFRDFRDTMTSVYRFLELPADQPAPATRRRLRNRGMRERIANFGLLRDNVPADVRELLDAEDLI